MDKSTPSIHDLAALMQDIEAAQRLLTHITTYLQHPTRYRQARIFLLALHHFGGSIQTHAERLFEQLEHTHEGLT